MKFSQTLALVALFTQSINSASIPADNNALDILAERAPESSAIVAPDHTLEKRKGGGGRGGGSSGGSSGGRSGGSSSGGGSSPPARAQPNSFAGGRTSAGSGAARPYGGGNYYGGGAAVPYTAGKRTPKGLIAGALLAPALILALMPGLWLWSVYPYHYTNPYRFRNESATDEQHPNGTNSSLPVMCVCQEFSVCGCDENTDQQYVNSLVGNGSYGALNKSLITVADVNGTQTIILNGTLPNGTTAPGGDDSGAINLALGKYTGYWAMGLIVLYGVFL